MPPPVKQQKSKKRSHTAPTKPSKPVIVRHQNITNNSSIERLYTGMADSEDLQNMLGDLMIWPNDITTAGSYILYDAARQDSAALNARLFELML